ncbi:type II toxin-antitoxin system RelE family toxin [Cohnella phaseoli]|uniref:mRNA-degrading endonuclease RelE of RelBE toxin-antitoxin system n=1 Tax=Cohnella phaseoli TaxID=456490 RepID=A0A3D9JPN4_9BACL|nr:hypothetical protein [Cohnella phaseoli]RED75968.1 mRNA-degrading endonuclease RelE of RelBE toxin-antitoxin system [Cohnella phaseoli]
MYSVRFSSKRVEKEVKCLEKKDRVIAEAVFEELMKEPRPAKYQYEQLLCNSVVKKLKAGRVRIFYMINENLKEIVVGRVCYRTSNTYQCEPSSWFRGVVA